MGSHHKDRSGPHDINGRSETELCEKQDGIL